ncbi:MAG: hypothetical protein L0177_10665, partial [Chloroflexi bacterium]|nr:hypothetical protein [Chloroflexota bacterium]
ENAERKCVALARARCAKAIAVHRYPASVVKLARRRDAAPIRRQGACDSVKTALAVLSAGTHRRGRRERGGE